MNGNCTSGMPSSGNRNAAIRPITIIETKNMIAVTGRRRLSSASVTIRLRETRDERRET
jgi:hypothetical protein